MPRKFGSKNKPKNPQPVESVEFDYDADNSDATYAALMTGQNPPPARAVVPGTEPVNTGMPFTEYNEDYIISASPAGQILFYIEGRVRLDQVGANEPIIADQKRLVWAGSFEEAVQKFSTYFGKLSTPMQKYSVISAGGSEAIS